ncbi:MAG: acetate--CoA ligase family protein, partial [Alphaproteobacteria bacterium]
LEVVRDPERFIAALAKANARDVPVVVLRPGRTERGREHLLSHSGRLAGSDGAFEAVFRRHGVLRASTMDEWWSTVLLMAHPRRPGPGGVAAIMDSGGQRSLLADDADELGVPWARIGAETKRRLAERLSYGLPAINPVDAWGGEPDWPDVFRDCFSAVVNDPDTAIGMLISDIGAGDSFADKLAKVCQDVAAATTKPVVAGTYTSRQFYPRYINELSRSGIPVLDGGRTSLLAIRHALAYRDHRARAAEPPPPAPDRATAERWRRRLGAVAALDEAESFAMLEDFGIPVAASRPAASLDEALAAAAALGYPAALKTAAGVVHKSDRIGVRLGLGDERALAAAYRDLAGRLGPRVLVAAMASPGVEVALGVVRDQEFGPIVMVGAGGVLVELLAEARFALAPVGEGEVLRMIGQLRLGRLLAGVRGRRPANVEALCTMVSRLSSMAAALGDSVAEIDVNPVLVGPERVVAVDALVRTSGRVELGRSVGEGAVASS